MDNKEVYTTKLNELKDHPTHKDKNGREVPSSFQFKRRMPGWYPDGYKNFLGSRREVFMEEFLKLDTDGLHPFPIPSSSFSSSSVSRVFPFEEPGANAKAEDWVAFYKWVVGHPISNGSDVLTTICRELASLVRKYNAVLYELRRLHYHENAPEKSALMPYNPHGGFEQNLPEKDTVEFIKRVGETEKQWAEVTKNIGEFLAEDRNGLRVTADMIEVNGYIVSMRVLAQSQPVPPGTARTEEVGGSSSHVSISSAFQAVPPP